MIFDDLPDGIKEVLTDYTNDPVFTEIPDVPTLFKNYKESKSFASKLRTELDSSIRVPSKEASEEDNTKFYADIMSKAPKVMLKPTDENGFSDVFTSMGKPESAEQYKFPEVEGVTLDDNRKKFLTESALSNDMTLKQFEGMAKNLLEVDKKMIEEQNFNAGKQDEALKQEWGMAYPDRMAKALQAFNSASGQAIDRINPEMAKVFYNVSEQIGTQEPQIGGHLGNNSGRRTPGEANRQIFEAMGNKDHIINASDSPERDRYLETEWTQLQADASGSPG